MREIDYTSSVTFLSKLFALSEDLVELRAIPNDGGGVKARAFIGQGGAADLLRFCQLHDIPGVAVYFGCSTRKPGSRQGRKEDLSELVACWVDIDLYHLGLTVNEVVAALNACACPPSFIISSGWGVHAYWLLREALPADALDEHEAVLKRLTAVFCGDPLPAQAAAVMRLVGTHNSKKDEWRECAVLAEHERLYELSDLAEMLDGLPPQLAAVGSGPLNPPNKGDAISADPFLDFAAIKRMDIEAELAAMRLHDPENKGMGVHRVTRDVSASLVARGHDDEAIFDRLIKDIEAKVIEAGEAWSPGRARNEARKLWDAIRGAHAKGWAPKMAPEAELPPGVVRMTPRQQERPDDDPLPASNAGRGRPTIPVRAGHLSEIADQGERLFLELGAPIYRRTSRLMRPVVEEDHAADGLKTKVARLVDVSQVFVVDYLGRLANWIKYDARSKKWVPCDPPKAVAETMLGREGEWIAPPVAGVVTTPTLRPDGSILSVEGYDAATRLILLAPPAMPIMSPQPSRAEALAALALLEGLLAEFCFIDEPSRSVALSALMTPVVRGALPVVPAHVMRAPIAGSGKSYLVDISAAISTGQRCPVISSGKSEEEQEKRLGAALLSGQPLVSIDNLNGELKGDALCQLVERPLVQIRILGRSELMRVETRATLFATGNNIVVAGDMVRRTLTSSMDANVERPELREFKQDPLSLVLADRGKYVAAVLTIVRAYQIAGYPGALPPLASYGNWSLMVRSALVWLDKADPVKTIEMSRENDPDLIALNAVVGAWQKAVIVGVEKTASELIALSQEVQKATRKTDDDPKTDPAEAPKVDPIAVELAWPDLAEALDMVAHGRRGVDATLLGKWLSGQQNKVVGAVKIIRSGSAAHVRRWKLSTNLEKT